MAIVQRENTFTEIVMVCFVLVFPRFEFQDTSSASHVAVWEFDPKQVYPCKRIVPFTITETPQLEEKALPVDDMPETTRFLPTRTS